MACWFSKSDVGYTLSRASMTSLGCLPRTRDIWPSLEVAVAFARCLASIALSMDSVGIFETTLRLFSDQPSAIPVSTAAHQSRTSVTQPLSICRQPKSFARFLFNQKTTALPTSQAIKIPSHINNYSSLLQPPHPPTPVRDHFLIPTSLGGGEWSRSAAGVGGWGGWLRDLNEIGELHSSQLSVFVDKTVECFPRFCPRPKPAFQAD